MKRLLCLAAALVLGGGLAATEPTYPKKDFVAKLTRAAVGQRETLGIRNNNPGNLRPNPGRWKRYKGAIGVDKDGYLIFRRPVDGLRSLVATLKIYRDKHHITTLRQISDRWVNEYTPEKRDEYARTLAWRAGKLSGRSGLSRFSRLALDDAGTLETVTKAIIWAENGYDPYSPELYARVFPRENGSGK